MEKNRELPTLEEIKQRLDYSPETGLFIHRINKGGAKKGKEAGTYDINGYRKLCVNGKIVCAHHAAWLLIHGRWPKDGMVIHHKNRLRDDNRADNLQEITQEQNIEESPYSEIIKRAIAEGNEKHISAWASRHARMSKYTENTKRHIAVSYWFNQLTLEQRENLMREYENGQHENIHK